MKHGFSFFLMLSIVCCASSASAYDATVSTLWPLWDYRASAVADYKSTHLLGPLLKYETKGIETEYAFRPFFYRALDDEGVSETDVLYPVFRHKSDQGTGSFHLLHLLNHDYGQRESGRSQRSYLFPFLFYGEEEQGTYAAFFPVHGTLYNWFGRDRISFTLFPLYGRTERKGTRIDNVLWPFFARISGEHESGFKAWPVYGQSRKEGVYRKTFFLWPVFFSESLNLNTDNPQEIRAAWPFYLSKESPKSSSRTILWPFFSKVENREKGYVSWNAPWPLVRVTRGKTYHGLKILPFYADETMDVKRHRWYLWPIYKVEEMNSELIMQRRDRILFFLYSDRRELKHETGDSSRRIDFWPFFGYQNSDGVSHLHVLSLIEPFFPGNQSIERLWTPLWRVYQQKWDQQGNRIVSLFWNLYWSERQDDRLAWELFPVVEYRKLSQVKTDISVFKGLFRYQKDLDGRQVNLFYLPWGIHWGDDEG